MKAFAQAFQLLIRDKLPVYLVMTGLYQNLYDLQNNPSITFLYRSPKILLEPLNIASISARYKEAFSLNDEEALLLANYTKGYPFAYQVLGYLLWENEAKTVNERILSLFDQYLQEFVYEKVWMELSGNDKAVLLAINGDGQTSIEEIKNRSKMNAKTLSVYRDRLIKRGILKSESYGVVSLKLPRFYEFMRQKAM